MKHRRPSVLAATTLIWAASAVSAQQETTATVGIVPPAVCMVGLETTLAAPGDCVLEDGLFASVDGGCKDLTTGIVWGLQSGQQVPSVYVSWEGAALYCSNLVEGGFDDWFLPSKDQLLEVLANGSATHMNVTNNINWSSTPKGKHRAWAVNLFGGGDLVTDYKASTRNCICARVPATPPPPGLDVDSISPASMDAGTTMPVLIVGAGFAAGASVTFEDGSGPAPQASGVVVAHDGLSLTAVVAVGGGGPPGIRVWDVRVTNTDSSTGVLETGFAVIK